MYTYVCVYLKMKILEVSKRGTKVRLNQALYPSSSLQIINRRLCCDFELVLVGLDDRQQAKISESPKITARQTVQISHPGVGVGQEGDEPQRRPLISLTFSRMALEVASVRNTDGQVRASRYHTATNLRAKEAKISDCRVWGLHKPLF